MGEMAALYSYFRVFGSSIKFSVTNCGASTTPFDNSWWVVLLADSVNTKPTSTISQLAMIPEAKVIDANVYNNTVRGKMYKSTANVLDIPVDTVVTGTGYRGTSAAAPTTPWYWHCCVERKQSSSTGVALNMVVRLKVEVTYYTRWETRILQWDD